MFCFGLFFFWLKFSFCGMVFAQELLSDSSMRLRSDNRRFVVSAVSPSTGLI